MINAIIIKNPFDAYKDMERIQSAAGCTVGDWLRAYYGADFTAFEVPSIVQLNGTPVLANASRELLAELAAQGYEDVPTWESPMKDGDVLTITAIPGVEIVIAIVVAIVVAVAVVLIMGDPALPSDTNTQGDTVYNLKGQTNQVRLGDPVECHYGQPRVFPSYAAPPFNRYIGNDQYQYSFLCVGLGEYEIEAGDIYIEDTPISSFDEVEAEVVPPGAMSTLFPLSVATSIEVSGIELYGSNQEEYPDPDGWFGGFIVNPAGTVIDKIEVDVNFPQGLYVLYQNLRYNKEAQVAFEAREVDLNGDAVGAWVEIINETITRKSPTAQRLTFEAAVTQGRYEVRGRRVGERNMNAAHISLVQWETLRGSIPDSTVYPYTTMIAFKILATNNINSNTRSRFNLYPTRKLPIYNELTDEWSDPTATRNPIWAFCDAFRARYGGRLVDEYLDLETLATMADASDLRGDEFNGTFDKAITIWEAAKSIARVQRSIPVPVGSRISMVRDEPQTLPAGMFNGSNMVAGSFKEEIEIFEFGAFDSLIVEYMDPLTWKPLEVLCVLPGGTSDNPDRVKLFGVTDRAQAFREGMYILAGRFYSKINYVFKTGLEGHIPALLDMVGIYHDGILGPRSGFVVAYDSGTKVATLSESVIFQDDATHVIVLRGTDGAAMGAPIEVTPGASSNKVILATAPPEALTFSPDKAPNLYFFGVQEFPYVQGKVVAIKPIDEETVELRLAKYDERLYSFDTFTVPTLEDATNETDPDAPVVDSVTITTVADKSDLVLLSWKPSWGAFRYEVQRTFDDPVTIFSPWEKVATLDRRETTYEMAALPTAMTVRVAAIGRAGRGGWRSSTVTSVGIPTSVPTSPTLASEQTDFDGLTASVAWQPVANAGAYQVAVHKTGNGTALRTVDINEATYDYSYGIADMLADDATPSRDLELKVYAFNAAGASEATVRSVTNPAPPVLTSPAAVLDSGDDWDFTWDALASIPADFAFYRVYGSTTPGFTPGPGNLLYEGADPFCTLEVLATTYWRVAAFDQWNSGDTDANFTGEQTLTI